MTQDTHDTTDADGDTHGPPEPADRTSRLPTSRRTFLGTTVAAASAVQASGAVAAGGGGAVAQETATAHGYGQGGYGAGPYGGDDVSSRWFDPYVNQNDVVENTGLNQAIRDYLQGNLVNTSLNTVIRSYLTGNPISS